MAKTKIRITKWFYDSENDNRQVGAGHVIEVDEKRADALIKKGVAEAAGKNDKVTLENLKPEKPESEKVVGDMTTEKNINASPVKKAIITKPSTVVKKKGGKK